eukprot:scaffold1695_cov167-Amphora_coffeaeformis.AAC.19
MADANTDYLNLIVTLNPVQDISPNLFSKSPTWLVRQFFRSSIKLAADLSKYDDDERGPWDCFSTSAFHQSYPYLYLVEEKFSPT